MASFQKEAEEGARKEMGPEVISIKPPPAILLCFSERSAFIVKPQAQYQSHHDMPKNGDLQNDSSHLTHMRQGVTLYSGGGTRFVQMSWW